MKRYDKIDISLDERGELLDEQLGEDLLSDTTLVYIQQIVSEKMYFGNNEVVEDVMGNAMFEYDFGNEEVNIPSREEVNIPSKEEDMDYNVNHTNLRYMFHPLSAVFDHAVETEEEKKWKDEKELEGMDSLLNPDKNHAEETNSIFSGPEIDNPGWEDPPEDDDDE